MGTGRHTGTRSVGGIRSRQFILLIGEKIPNTHTLSDRVSSVSSVRKGESPVGSRRTDFRVLPVTINKNKNKKIIN